MTWEMSRKNHAFQGICTQKCRTAAQNEAQNEATSCWVSNQGFQLSFESHISHLRLHWRRMSIGRTKMPCCMKPGWDKKRSTSFVLHISSAVRFRNFINSWAPLIHRIPAIEKYNKKKNSSSDSHELVSWFRIFMMPIWRCYPCWRVGDCLAGVSRAQGCGLGMEIYGDLLRYPSSILVARIVYCRLLQ